MAAVLLSLSSLVVAHALSSLAPLPLWPRSLAGARSFSWSWCLPPPLSSAEKILSPKSRSDAGAAYSLDPVFEVALVPLKILHSAGAAVDDESLMLH